jgi:lactoylglutathione lyase
MTTQDNTLDMPIFGATILYTDKPRETIEFYERVFGLKRRFFVETPGFGELETGTTSLIISNIAIEKGERGYPEASTPEAPANGFHIAFVTSQIDALYAHAIAEGATPVKAPEKMFWGGSVAFVRDLNGITVSLTTPRG